MEQSVAEAIRKSEATINFELARKMKAKKLKTYARNSFFHIPDFTVEDMEQELLTVLYTAVQLYDPTRGRTFDTFLQMLWRNKIGSLRRATSAIKRTAELVSLDVEAVQVALDARKSVPSAEDEVMARESLRELLAG